MTKTIWAAWRPQQPRSFKLLIAGTLYNGSYQCQPSPLPFSLHSFTMLERHPTLELCFTSHLGNNFSLWLIPYGLFLSCYQHFRFFVIKFVKIKVIIIRYVNVLILWGLQPFTAVTAFRPCSLVIAKMSYTQQI